MTPKPNPTLANSAAQNAALALMMAEQIAAITATTDDRSSVARMLAIYFAPGSEVPLLRQRWPEAYAALLRAVADQNQRNLNP